jgi:hyperosmotically inducible protein
MKTISPVLVAVLSGALLLRLMPGEIKADDALPQPATEQDKASAQAETNSLPGSIDSKDGVPDKAEDSGEPSDVSQPAPGGSSDSPSDQTNEEVPPVFQVSPDPRDQVQFLVNKGIVTIQGSVGTRELARTLIKKYARMPGVRQVRNRLTVRTNNDAAIAVQVREALSRDPDTRVGGIGVTVFDGIVFLSGVVSSAQESERAENLARGLQGVRRVNNGLRLPNQIRSPVPVTSRVRTTLRR